MSPHSTTIRSSSTLVAVPSEAFYINTEAGRHLVRFACCKQLDVIDAAAGQLVDAFAGGTA